MSRYPLLTLLTACEATLHPAPPPAMLGLEIGELIEGRPVTFRATGAMPGEAVWFVASRELDLAAPLACPWPQLDCLDVREPLTRVGRAVADGQGVAEHVDTVPLQGGVRVGQFQAVARTARSVVLTRDVSLVDPETTLVLASDAGNVTDYEAVDLGLTPAINHGASAVRPQSVRAMTDGPDGWVYAIGFGGSELSRFDPRTGEVQTQPMPGAPGWRVDITNLPGDPRLFVLREVNGDRLETFDPSTGVWDDSVLALGGVFTSPRALSDGPDGRLWALDSVGVLQALSVSPFGRAVIADLDAPGTFEDLTGLRGSDLLYILRDTGTGSAIDTFDTVTGIHVQDVVVLPGIRSTGGQRNVLTDTNDGRLVVAGDPDAVVIDLATGQVSPLPTTLGQPVMGVTNLDP